MSCNNKTKQRCKKQYASCVSFEGTTNANSTLMDECLSIEETTQDTYDQLEQINLSQLGDKCLEYVTVDGKIFVKNVLLKFEQEICDLKEQVQTLQNTAFCDLTIADCGINTLCLQGVCENEILTVKDLFQSIINRLCI